MKTFTVFLSQQPGQRLETVILDATDAHIITGPGGVETLIFTVKETNGDVTRVGEFNMANIQGYKLNDTKGHWVSE